MASKRPSPVFGKREAIESLQQIAELRKRWDELSSKGAQASNDLVNTIIQLQFTDANNWGVFEDNDEVKANVKFKLEQQQQKQLRALTSCLADLVKALQKAQAKVAALDAVCVSRLSVSTATDTCESPVLATLSLPRCLRYAKEALAMYLHDLAMKRAVTTDICAQSNRGTLISYVSTWLMSPGVNSNRIEELLQLFSVEEKLAQEL